MLIAVFSSDEAPAGRYDSGHENCISPPSSLWSLQYVGQTTFKSLNKHQQAVFFSLLRKVFIVVPLTYLLPYALGMGTDGVFMAEPVSNVLGGCACFFAMLATVLPELKQMEKVNAEPERNSG